MQYFKTLPNRKIVEYHFLLIVILQSMIWHSVFKWRISVTQIHRNNKYRKVRKKINVFMFPLYFLSKNFSSKTHAFCSNFWNNTFLLYCHSKFHHMSVMSQSSIKVTSMTHINSSGVKVKSEGTSKWNLIMILW